MSIDSKSLGPINAYQKLDELNQNRTQKLSQSNADKTTGVANALEKVSQNVSKAEMRIEQQASLVSHLFGDGKSTEQSTLKMTYQSAIEKLNEILMADMGLTADSAEQSSDTSVIKPISEEALQEQGGMEFWTPENTAKRIVDGATSFFEGFKNAHPELEGEALMSQFMDVVGGGLIQGFDEARSILGDLNVLEGTIAENIDTTYQLVEQGMQAFEKEFLAMLAETMAPVEENQTAENN